MPSPRPRRAMLAAVLGIALIAQIVLVSGVIAADVAPDSAPPQPGTSLSKDQLAALRAVREDRPAALRGVLAGDRGNRARRSCCGAPSRPRRPRHASHGKRLDARRGDDRDRVGDRPRRPRAPRAPRRPDRESSDMFVEAYLSPAVLRARGGPAGRRMPSSRCCRRWSSPSSAQASASTGRAPGRQPAISAPGSRWGSSTAGSPAWLPSSAPSSPASVHARCYTSVGSFTAALNGCEIEGIDYGTGVAETIADMAPGYLVLRATRTRCSTTSGPSRGCRRTA